jgi:hypothetical protein
MKMATAEVNGVQLFYELNGSGDVPAAESSASGIRTGIG